MEGSAEPEQTATSEPEQTDPLELTTTDELPEKDELLSELSELELAKQLQLIESINSILPVPVPLVEGEDPLLLIPKIETVNEDEELQHPLEPCQPPELSDHIQLLESVKSIISIEENPLGSPSTSAEERIQLEELEQEIQKLKAENLLENDNQQEETEQQELVSTEESGDEPVELGALDQVQEPVFFPAVQEEPMDLSTNNSRSKSSPGVYFFSSWSVERFLSFPLETEANLDVFALLSY